MTLSQVQSAPAVSSLLLRPKILVVDDEEMLRQVLVETLMREGYEVVTAEDGITGLECLQKQRFAVIISDQNMPRMRGLDFLARARELQPRSTRILVTGVVELETALDAINRGELYRFIIKPWIREELLVTLKNAVQRSELLDKNEALMLETRALNDQLKRANQHLEQQLTRELDQNRKLEILNKELNENLNRSVQLSVRTLETFYPVLGGQIRRVQKLCASMAESLDLDVCSRQTLDLGAQLYDIGMLGIPRDLIKRWMRSPDALSQAESQLIRQHPLCGQEFAKFNDRLKSVGELIRWHHERYDGKGYPDGLAGEMIPWLARLLSVAVAYVDAGGNDAALSRVRRDSGTVLDPEATRVFLRVIPHISLPKGQREVLLGELRPGMVLARGVYTASGMLLVPAGEELSSVFIDKLHNHHRLNPIKQILLVQG